MKEEQVRQQVSQIGRQLLDEQLVARTWGNFSARIDATTFGITPSGLGYEDMKPEDIVVYHMDTKTWDGDVKPSSEKGIHAAAYELFPDAGFVIHTHQIYATALGLTGPENFHLTEDEKARLGKVAFAKYGLPGTKKLKKNVADAMKTGARIVMMVNHGALIVGKDMDDALDRARLLEHVAKRNYKGDEADLREAIIASLDDMAQMTGRSIPFASDANKAKQLLTKHNVVLLPKEEIIVHAADADEEVTLKLLAEKACIAEKHCKALGIKKHIGRLDCMLMRFVYLKKYSKKKDRK